MVGLIPVIILAIALIAAVVPFALWGFFWKLLQFPLP